MDYRFYLTSHFFLTSLAPQLADTEACCLRKRRREIREHIEDTIDLMVRAGSRRARCLVHQLIACTTGSWYSNKFNPGRLSFSDGKKSVASDIQVKTNSIPKFHCPSFQKDDPRSPSAGLSSCMRARRLVAYVVSPRIQTFLPIRPHPCSGT